MYGQRQLGITASHMAKSQEKLSSGYAINRAADNAAGLSISEKMRRQIRGLDRASTNARDGISLVQIADGALVEVHEMLQRGNQLAVQAANGTNSESDRVNINAEIEQLKKEIDSITARTKFNELEIFPPTGEWPRFERFKPESKTEKAMNALADKIADEYVPNAVAQILDRIPSLKDAMDLLVADNGKDPYNMTLNIDYIDGVSNTLAFVQASFSLKSSGEQDFKNGSLLMKVDKDDFPSLDLDDDMIQTLESTIAHEMMHGIMDAVFPSRMCGTSSAEDFPKWFKEGTAQLTGGGFTTGWNDWLHNIVSGLEDADDDSEDAEIKKYLTKSGYTVDAREYGHGYLAAAYACYLASGSDEVSQESLLDGADKIFKAFIDAADSDSFDSVIAAATGVSVADLKAAINGGSEDSPAGAGASKMGALEFVRRLGVASLNGAGSIIADALDTGGDAILGNTAKKDDQPIRITTSTNYLTAKKAAWKQKYVYKGSASVKLHIGADAENYMELRRFSISSEALGLKDTNLLTADNATAAIDEFSDAIQKVSLVRSYYGAVQNRLEHTIKNLDNVVENTTAAESRIRDTDIPEVMMSFSTYNILMQAGQSVLAQANQSNNGALVLLT